MEQEATVSPAPPLSTTDARLGQTVRNEVYTALPLVMPTGGPRDPIAFMFLQPGVQSIGRWGNVMGGQDFSNEMYVDGVPITNATIQGEGRNLSFGISVEAVDQFQVETSGTAVMSAARAPRTTSIKSGTNRIRGAAYEYFRDSALDAPGFFARATRAATTAPERVRAHARRADPKNKLFFFVSYDGYRDSRETSRGSSRSRRPRGATATSARCRCRSSTRATTRPNPNGTGFIRDPFPGNIIPANRISPQSRYFQSFLPAAHERGPAEQLLARCRPASRTTTSR